MKYKINNNVPQRFEITYLYEMKILKKKQPHTRLKILSPNTFYGRC